MLRSAPDATKLARTERQTSEFLTLNTLRLLAEVPEAEVVTPPVLGDHGGSGFKLLGDGHLLDLFSYLDVLPIQRMSTSNRFLIEGLRQSQHGKKHTVNVKSLSIVAVI